MSRVIKLLRTKKEKQYYVPTVDSQGHSVHVSFRMMPGMARELEIILVHRDVFGWKTPSDFYRWAAKEGMQKIGEELKNPALNTLHQQVESIARIVATQTDMSRFRESFKQLQALVDSMRDLQDSALIEEMLSGVWDHIMSMDSTGWKKHYVREFRLRFGPLVKRIARTISLRPKDQTFDADWEQKREKIERIEQQMNEFAATQLKGEE